MSYRNMLILLLFIIPFISSAWHESADIYVLDEDNRPIRDANVSVAYQKDNFPIYKDNMDGFIWKLTNQVGKASFNFGNMVDTPQYELRYYFVTVDYGNLHKKEKVLCSGFSDDCHPNNFKYKFNLKTRRLNLHIVDRDNNPISGAVVYFNGFKYISGDDGFVWLTVPKMTSYNVVVEYKGKKRTLEGRMGADDLDEKVVYNRHNVYFRIIDDQGNPLPAEVKVGDVKKKTDDNGRVRFLDLVNSSVNLFVRYEGGFKELNIPVSSEEIEVVVDNTPPKIESVSNEVDVKKSAIIIYSNLYDPGLKASGLSESNPAQLQYNIEGQGWASAPMYPLGNNKFQATIPLVYNKHIAFDITVYDKQGNSRSYSDEIYVEGSEDSSAKPESSDSSDIDVRKDKGGSNNLLIYVVIIILVALIAYKKYTGEF